MKTIKPWPLIPAIIFLAGFSLSMAAAIAPWGNTSYDNRTNNTVNFDAPMFSIGGDAPRVFIPLVNNMTPNIRCTDYLILNASNVEQNYIWEGYGNATFGCRGASATTWIYGAYDSPNNTNKSIYHVNNTLDPTFKNSTRPTDILAEVHFSNRNTGDYNDSARYLSSWADAAGTTNQAAGLYGQAGVFDGSTYYEANDESVGDTATNGMTIITVFRSTGFGTNLFSKGDANPLGFRAYMEGNGDLNCVFGNTGAGFQIATVRGIVQNRWMVSVCRHTSGSEIEALLWDTNGTFMRARTATALTTIGSNNNAWRIGSDHTGSGLFSGLVDAYIVLNRTMTNDELNATIAGILSRNFTLITQRASELNTPSAAAPNVTIINPINSTFLRSNVTLNFTVTGSSASYNCTRVIPAGNSTSMGNTTNNTFTTAILNNLDPITFNLNVSCSGAAGSSNTDTRTILFSIIHSNVTANASTSPIYETNRTAFNLTVRVADNINRTTAAFFWNNTRYANTSFSQASDNFTFGANVTPPLLQVNNTGVSWYWSYNLTYTNGTVLTNVTTAAGNQSINYAYYISSTSVSSTTPPESQSFLFNSTIGKFLNTSTLRGNWTFNGTRTGNTSYVFGASTELFGFSTILPLIENATSPVLANTTLYIDFGDNRRTVYSSDTTVTITRITLGNCTSGTPSNRVITFIGRNEEGFANLTENFTIDATFTVWNISQPVNRNYSFHYENAQSYSLCMSPANATVQTNATLEFLSGSSPLRTYYLVNASLTSLSTNASSTLLNLYLLNSTYATRISYTIQDSSGTPLEGVYLKLLRYSPSTNAFATVEIGRSDYLGNLAVQARQFDGFYKIILDRGANILKETDTIKILTTSNTLTISPQTSIDYFQYYDKIGFACSYSNATLTLSCTVSDSSNLMTQACLTIYRIGTLSDDVITDTCQSGSAVTIGYTWASWSELQGRKFNYRLYAILNTDTNNRVFLLNRYLELSLVAGILGTEGIIMALLIVLCTGTMGFRSPFIAIVMAIVGLLGSAALGLISLGAIGAASIVLVGFIILWRLRK